MTKDNECRRIFPVTGMSCAACATRVEKTIAHTKGVRSAAVNFAASEVTVEYDSDACTPEQLREAVREAGYDIICDDPEHAAAEAEAAHAAHMRSLRRRTIWAAALSLLLVAAEVLLPHRMAGYVEWIMATPVVFILGRGFFVGAWRQLRHRTANMDTLVACSTGIAYLFSLFNLLAPQFWLSRGVEPHLYFESSAVIITFILLGRYMEDRAKRNASSAISRLMGLRPKSVCKIEADGSRHDIPVDRIAAGDLILLRPGERVAADGVVEHGSSYVDESMLNGEPVPAAKTEGDALYAGTVNGNGSLTMRARTVGSDTMLMRIVRMVHDAQGSKPPVQRLADRIASVFVPVIMAIAFISFLAWIIFAPVDGLSHGILAMVTVLIIACPCALGLATPTAITVGIGRAAERGILIKDAESIETARTIDTVIFDKTGTLTEGRPEVTDTAWFGDGHAAAHILLAIERLSDHPLAQAIVHHLEADGHNVTAAAAISAAAFENIVGRGITARVSGKRYIAGNRAMVIESGIDITPDAEAEASRLEADGKSVVWFAVSDITDDGTRDKGGVLAIAGVTDRIREGAREAVEALRSMGIESVMLTGDNAAAAQRVARMTGITTFRASMLPQQKAEYLQALRAAGHHTAMAGDGINDSAALAEADLGIAMGGGSDIAISAAGMTIVASDPRKIAEAVRLSQLTVRTIRQNLFWAFFYNMIGVPVAAGILYPICGFLLNPMIGGAAMALSSVCVVSNSLRLRRLDTRPAALRRPTAGGNGNNDNNGNGANAAQSVSDIHAAAATATATPSQQIIQPQKEIHIMKKRFNVEGMMCDHCRAHVEKALNSIEGVKAVVTLSPAEAEVEFTNGEKSLEELQSVVTEKAGDYRLSEK